VAKLSLKTCGKPPNYQAKIGHVHLIQCWHWLLSFQSCSCFVSKFP
jgi:hypothetical protein